MSCSFDLGHYAEILEAGKAGGYRFAFFGDGPERGDIYLRHDVDLSLDAALRMAELEAERDARHELLDRHPKMLVEDLDGQCLRYAAAAQLTEDLVFAELLWIVVHHASAAPARLAR